MINPAIERLRRRWRDRRMRLCRELMGFDQHSRILDVGGTFDLWADDRDGHNVTLLNLPKIASELNALAKFDKCVLVGDICRMPDLPRDFDMVFSNSVLEHVGSARRQQQYADAIRRSKAYWVQVPAPSFPIEVHCRKLLWWLRPASWRRRTIRTLKRDNALFLARQMAGTRPISAKRLQELFPDGQILAERFLGLTKSYYVWRRGV